ncbi:MAG: GntR family transcriptional regulator, partial [Thermodesulfobacteriota bacterium]
MNMSSSGKPRKNGISVREKTYDYLKSNILSGRFVPGERLAEEHLAEELGVSRTPVREALHKLEQEGLIEPLESRGFCVPHDSPEEIEDLFDIRTVLEGYTLKIICERITDEQIEKLEEMIDKAEDALRRIVREYTREAGVRNLEREIASLCRKVARRVAEGATPSVTV